MKDILSRFWEAWKKVGQFIGKWVARVILTLFYFTIFLPFGLIVTLFGNLLDIKDIATPTWLERKTKDLSLEDARRLS
ncbi:MAG: hypothetical protein GY805_34015 [Chloroflexi bacterium]|nr:hypothetical protein [Chloroflexota bacterium]